MEINRKDEVGKVGDGRAIVSPDLNYQTLWPAQQPPVRLAVLASGNGSNFEAIMEAIQTRKLKAEVAIVLYNNPEAGVAARAERLGVPAKLMNHRDFTQREEFDQAIAQVLQSYQVEWVILAGWMRRLTQVLLTAFPKRVLNIHPSLLPSFPGTHAVEQALRAGVKVSGCTVHYAELVVDSGPIIAQAAVPVLPNDTVETLQRRIQVQEHLIYPLAIAQAISVASGL